MPYRLFIVALMTTLLIFSGTPAQRRQQPQPAPRQKAPAPSGGATPAQRAVAVEEDVAIDALLSSDSYAVYIEVRRVGQLIRSKEFSELLTLVPTLAGPSKELDNTLNFFRTHAEALENAQLVSVAMPARPGLPQALGVLQFPSAEAAKAVEPGLRGLIKEYETAAGGKRAEESAKNAGAGQTSGAKKPSPAKVGLKTNAKDEPPKPAFYFRRMGRLLLTSDAPVNTKMFRRAGQHQPLAASPHFQAARTRLASEQVFVYFDVTLAEKGARVEREAFAERMRKEEEARAARSQIEPDAAEKEEDPAPSLPLGEVQAELAATAEANVNAPVVVTVPPPPQNEVTVSEEGIGVGVVPMAEEGGPEPRQPNEEEMAMARADMMVSRVFGMMFGGLPVWPEAVGLGGNLDGEEIVLRALLLNDAGGEIRVIPFLPLLVSGPEIVTEAASVAPAASEIFVSFSLDWQRIYANLLGTVDRAEAEMEQERRNIGEPEKTGAAAQTPEKSIEALEKLFGFKVKEELLPALGNEVAVSGPLDWFGGPASNRMRRASKAPDAAEPGVVVFVSLNNAETVRKILPRLLAAIGMGAVPKTERRAGVDITSSGGVSYAFINNYLALSTTPAPLRHAADALNEQRMLAADEGFRSSVQWQPRQKLAQVYVSRGLMESWQREMRVFTDPNDREMQDIIARFDVRPRAASHVITREGGSDIFHEARFPTGILKLLASSGTVMRAKGEPLRRNESAAILALYNVADAEETFKETEGKGSYASLEELFGDAGAGKSDMRVTRMGVLSKDGIEKLEYRINVSAAGDKFTVHAVPKEYGKSGRRSFYLDETGVVRGADHAGQPANAGDPPVD